MEKNLVYTYNAKVLRVIDGDTLDCEIDLGFFVKIEKRVRLSGIDTAEKNSRIISEREKAAKATARVKYSIESKTVIIETELDKDDKYGRVLASVYETELDYKNKTSLNDKLVAEDLAYLYSGGKRNV